MMPREATERLSQRTEKEAHLGVERTARINRWSFDHGGVYPTNMASIQAEECARDKPAVHSILRRGHRFLAVLWDSDEAATTNCMECHNFRSGVDHVICQAKIWQVIRMSSRLCPLVQPQPFPGKSTL